MKKNAHTLQVWRGGCQSVEPLLFRPLHCYIRYIRSYCQNSDFGSILYPYRHSLAGFTDLASKALIQCGKSCKITETGFSIAILACRRNQKGHTKPVTGRPRYSSANTSIPILSVQYRLASCSPLNSYILLVCFRGYFSNFSLLLDNSYIYILISVVGPPALLVLSKEYHLQMKSCNPRAPHNMTTSQQIKSRK